MNVITFENYRPGPRQDGEPWTQVTIEESATPDGTWTLIDTITLSPVDTDPASPQLRSFTTENATLTDGWYRVTFLDADGDTQVTDPVEHTQTTRYFTVTEFRTRYPDLTDTKYPDDTVEQYRQLAEQAFEDACQRAFVPRTATETIVEDRGNRWLQYTRYDANYATPGRHLAHSDVRRVLSATDSTNTTVDLSGVQLNNGWVYGLTATGPVTITYEYGADQPPLRVKQAVMSLAREWMVSGPVTDRQTGIPVEGGGTISLAVPGGRFGTFGIPEVDSTVAQYGVQVFVA